MLGLVVSDQEPFCHPRHWAKALRFGLRQQSLHRRIESLNSLADTGKVRSHRKLHKFYVFCTTPHLASGSATEVFACNATLALRWI